MANFRTHMTVAVAGSCLATLASASYFDLTMYDLGILLVLGAVSGLLPDVDADHSIALRWVFRVLTVAVVVLVIVFTDGQPLFYVMGALCVAVLVLHIVIFRVFRKLTVHRGLFHSVPAALLLALIVLWSGLYVFMWSLVFSWLAASFVASGYLLHLVLDELYSVDLTGGQLKASFGTALTIFSLKSWFAYCVLYLVIFVGTLWLPMPNLMAYN